MELAGVVRVVNRSGEGGRVSIVAVDDAGVRMDGPTLAIGPGEAVEFDSADLAYGNPEKGLTPGIGAASAGHWRLELRSDLDVEVLAYVRAWDGFLTAMHDLVEPGPDGHVVEIFNPEADALRRTGLLRLINPGGVEARVTVRAIDEAGTPVRAGAAIDLPAGGAKTLSVEDLDASGDGAGSREPAQRPRLTGARGGRAGVWRLLVSSAEPVAVMGLLRNPDGHLANLSTRSLAHRVPPEEADAVAGEFRRHGVPLFPSAVDPDLEGFVRILNRSAVEGRVHVAAVDDAGRRVEAGALTLAGHGARQFDSGDLEHGNASAGPWPGTGAAQAGHWRLELASELDIEVRSYVRAWDGFVTSAHDVVEPGAHGHRIALFRSSGNAGQTALLRLINPTETVARVTISGTDDEGAPSRGRVRLGLPAGGARTLTAAELESAAGRAAASAAAGSAGSGLEGELGEGTGNWRLAIVSEPPVTVMNLLSNAAGPG